jgi:hypothetical protein
VEHDIQGSDVDLSVVEFVFADPNMLGASREEISKVRGGSARWLPAWLAAAAAACLAG